jgi:phosphohistidine swiveling domain-containing protein
MENDKIDLSTEHKIEYEISRFEGSIFCFSHFLFSQFFLPGKLFTLYTKENPDIYWLGISVKENIYAGQLLYEEYGDASNKLKTDFYLKRDACQAKLNQLIAGNNFNADLYQEFITAVNDFSKLGSSPLDGLERVVAEKINTLITDNTELETITFPLFTIYIQKQNESLLEIINNLNQHDLELLKQGNDNLTEYQQLPIILKQHQQEWYWALANYASEYQSEPQDFLVIMIDLMNNLQHENAVITENKLKRQKKIKLLADSSVEVKKIIELLDIIIELRDQRKAHWIRVGLLIKAWFRTMADYYNLSATDLMWLTWLEQCKLMPGNNETMLKIIQDRKNGCAVFYGYHNQSNIILTGQEATDAIDFFLQQTKNTELHGMSVSAGRVSGRIHNINSTKDFNSFTVGEILAASHTTPDYLSIMKKAKAILTERGGITSHAAIVARELKIPCIVGIRGLFDNFKNGDEVEVDANLGVVRIKK